MIELTVHWIVLNSFFKPRSYAFLLDRCRSGLKQPEQVSNHIGMERAQGAFTGFSQIANSTDVSEILRKFNKWLEVNIFLFCVETCDLECPLTIDRELLISSGKLRVNTLFIRTIFFLYYNYWIPIFLTVWLSKIVRIFELWSKQNKDYSCQYPRLTHE